MKTALLQLIKSLKDAFPDIIRQNIPEDVNQLIEFDIEANGLNQLGESEVKMLDPAILVDAEREKELFEKHQFKNVHQCEYPTKAVKAAWNIAVRALQIIHQVNSGKIAMMKCAANFSAHNLFIMTNFNYLEHYYDTKQVRYPTYRIQIVDNKTLQVGKLLLLFLFQVVQDPLAFDCVPDIPGFGHLIETAKKEGKAFCNRTYQQLAEMIKKYNARLQDRTSSTAMLAMPIDEIVEKNSELITYLDAVLSQKQPVILEELLNNISQFHFETDIQYIAQELHNLEMGLTTRYIYTPRANTNYLNEIEYLTSADQSSLEPLIFMTSADQTNDHNTLETLREYLALMREQTDKVKDIIHSLTNLVPACIQNKIKFYQNIISISEQLKNKKCSLKEEEIIEIYNKETFQEDLNAIKNFISKAEQNSALYKNIAQVLNQHCTILTTISGPIERASQIIREHVLQMLIADINTIQKSISDRCRVQIQLAATEDEYQFFIAKISFMLTLKNRLVKECKSLQQKYAKCDRNYFELLNQISLEINADIIKWLSKLQTIVLDKYVLKPLPFKTIENEHHKTIVTQQIINVQKAIEKIKLVLQFIQENFLDEQLEIIDAINNALKINNDQITVLTQMIQSYGDLENLCCRLAELNQKIQKLEQQKNEQINQGETWQKLKQELTNAIQPCIDREQCLKQVRQLSAQLEHLTNTTVEGVNIEKIKKLDTELSAANTEKGNLINTQQSPMTFVKLFFTTIVSDYDPNTTHNALTTLNTTIARLTQELATERQPLIQHQAKCDVIRLQIETLTKTIHDIEIALTPTILDNFNHYKECVENHSKLQLILQSIQERITEIKSEIEKVKQQINEKINSIYHNLQDTCQQFHAIIRVLALQTLKADDLDNLELKKAEILKNITFQNRHTILTLILNNDDTKSRHQHIEYFFNKIEHESNKIAQCIAIRHEQLRLHQLKIATYHKFFIDNADKALLERTTPPVKQSNPINFFLNNLPRSRSASPTLTEQYGASLLPISAENYFQTFHQYFLEYITLGNFESLKQTLMRGSEIYSENNKLLDKKYRSCMYNFIIKISNIIFNDIEPHIKSCYLQMEALTTIDIQKQKEGLQSSISELPILARSSQSESRISAPPPNALPQFTLPVVTPVEGTVISTTVVRNNTLSSTTSPSGNTDNTDARAKGPRT